jgi:hypothetical protein
MVRRKNSDFPNGQVINYQPGMDKAVKSYETSALVSRSRRRREKCRGCPPSGILIPEASILYRRVHND